MKKYRREHYSANKEQYYARNAKTKQQIKEIIWNAKKDPCVDCGSCYPDEPWLIEFDHLDEYDKVLDVSRLVSWGSVKKVREEMAKCEAVCVLCHRRRTAKRAGWTGLETVVDTVSIPVI